MKQPLPPKYQDPVSGKTWNGKGKAPGWIVEATKKGTRDDFLIGKAAKPTVKKAAAKKSVAVKPVATKKPAAKKASEVSKPAASKKAPAAKKLASVKKAAPAKPAAKPVAKTAAKPAAKVAAKPTVKKAVVAKKVTPKDNSAPKGDAASVAVTAPADVGQSN
jgi:hypothetical protein